MEFACDAGAFDLLRLHDFLGESVLQKLLLSELNRSNVPSRGKNAYCQYDDA